MSTLAGVRQGQIRWQVPVFGALLGLSISQIGFTDYAALHAMFTFKDLRMLLTFAGAVMLLAVGFRLIPWTRALPRRAVNRSVIVGGALFGMGWAVSGVCPGSALAQLGEGKAFALVSLAGIAVGSLLYGQINARWLRWSRGSCG